MGFVLELGEVVEDVGYVVCVFFFLGQDFFENVLGGGVVVIEVGDDFVIVVDGDVFGDQVFGDYVFQGFVFDVFGMGVFFQVVWIEVWFVVQLYDVFG